MQEMSRNSGKLLLGLMVFGVLAAAAFTANPAQAQTMSNGPYYATPSWDQTLPAATRFIVLSNFNNEAVLDRNTGLVWARSPLPGVGGWGGIRFGCALSRTGGQMGWRLPSFAELASLIDPSVSGKGLSLPAGHPFLNVVAEHIYWSATTDSSNSNYAFYVLFTSGGIVGSGLPKTDINHGWCARGPMNADQY